MMRILAQTLETPAGRPLLALPEMTLQPGQCWALLGPNGAGKSTFLRFCAGRETAEADPGRLWLGQPLPRWSDAGWARVRSFLPQHHHLSAPLTVQALIAMAAFPWGGGHERLADAMAEVIATWDVASLLTRRWHELSGGEQQRVQLARSALQLALAPAGAARLWLLDEPLSALDWPHQRGALDACRQAAASGALVVASLHDMNAALAMATHVLVLGQGGVLMQGVLEPERMREALEQAFSARLGWARHPEDGRPWLVPLR
ncbi:MAG: ATP-binding cassette domain-containing protein [Perlucidibaca sp.]